MCKNYPSNVKNVTKKIFQNDKLYIIIFKLEVKIIIKNLVYYN